MTAPRSLSVLAALALIFLPTLTREGTRAATPPGPYVLTDLGTLGGLSAQAYDLNETAQVTGYATRPPRRGTRFSGTTG